MNKTRYESILDRQLSKACSPMANVVGTDGPSDYQMYQAMACYFRLICHKKGLTSVHAV